ncbi:MAG: BrnT family toxin [Dehalococcoidia bacterium]
MLRFKWDREKAFRNQQKHGVAFDEAATIFGDRLSFTKSDPAHSHPDDDRFVTIGQSSAGRILVVAHADDADTVRIISARLATRRERIQYESEP